MQEGVECKQAERKWCLWMRPGRLTLARKLLHTT